MVGTTTAFAAQVGQQYAQAGRERASANGSTRRPVDWHAARGIAFDFNTAIARGCCFPTDKPFDPYKIEKAFLEYENGEAVVGHTQLDTITCIKTCLKAGKEVFILSESDPYFSSKDTAAIDAKIQESRVQFQTSRLSKGKQIPVVDDIKAFHSSDDQRYVSGEESIRRWFGVLEKQGHLSQDELDKIHFVVYHPEVHFNDVDRHQEPLGQSRKRYIDYYQEKDLSFHSSKRLSFMLEVHAVCQQSNRRVPHTSIVYCGSNEGHNFYDRYTPLYFPQEYPGIATTRLIEKVATSIEMRRHKKTEALSSQLRAELVGILNGYIGSGYRFLAKITGLESDHSYRAEAVRDAIAGAESLEEVEAILLNQRYLYEKSCPTSLSSRSLLDYRWADGDKSLSVSSKPDKLLSRYSRAVLAACNKLREHLPAARVDSEGVELLGAIVDNDHIEIEYPRENYALQQSREEAFNCRPSFALKRKIAYLFNEYIANASLMHHTERARKVNDAMQRAEDMGQIEAIVLNQMGMFAKTANKRVATEFVGELSLLEPRWSELEQCGRAATVGEYYATLERVLREVREELAPPATRASELELSTARRHVGFWRQEFLRDRCDEVWDLSDNRYIKEIPGIRVGGYDNPAFNPKG
ncbi:MAG: hypothetical protein K0U29_07860 [Gammaproteobacteria bacterium]|nr:hypothetical protein [Gammaproteobacteria bacterium]MCH9744827.1 hypothetical protein [Gammaproteobacteria bacterium]